MTLAPAHAHAREHGGSAATATVTAVLVLRDPGPWLGEALDSLARQTRAPERLLVVDDGADGEAVEAVRAHPALREAIASIRFTTVPPGATLGAALRTALADSPDSPTLPARHPRRVARAAPTPTPTHGARRPTRSRPASPAVRSRWSTSGS